MTCYGCDHVPCPLYEKAYREAKDDIDRYLVIHSVKKGCYMGYDKHDPCYPIEASEL